MNAETIMVRARQVCDRSSAYPPNLPADDPLRILHGLSTTVENEHTAAIAELERQVASVTDELNDTENENSELNHELGEILRFLGNSDVDTARADIKRLHAAIDLIPLLYAALASARDCLDSVAHKDAAELVGAAITACEGGAA